MLAEVAEEAGFPAGVINVVTHAAGAAGAIADEFFDRPEVRVINLIGGVKTARMLLDAAIANEETFGPVVVVEAVDTPEEAIAAANRTMYGLTSSILAGNTYKAF